MFIRLLIVTLMVSLIVDAGFAYSIEDDECLYNIEAIGKPKFLQSSDFSIVDWNDKAKVATTVTKQKESLVVKYSACENIGVEAELSIDAKNISLSQSKIANRIAWLSKKILEKGEDVNTVIRLLDQNKFRKFFKKGIYNKKKIVLDIPSRRYMELILQVEIVKERLVINLVAVSF